MEDDRFDRLARGLAGLNTRRGTVAGLLGGLAFPLMGASRTDARTRRGQVVQAEKKRKKKCQSGLLTCKVKQGRKKKTLCVDGQNDAANCGSCGTICPTGQSCRGGACSAPPSPPAAPPPPPCPEGTTRCGADCVDTTRDVHHCGGCGEACPGDVANECVEGVCQCFGREACTGGWHCCPAKRAVAGCYPLNENVSNCGACGTLCGIDQATNTCTEGVCTCSGVICPDGITCHSGLCTCGSGLPCLGGLTCCSGHCWNLSTDINNCGTCDHACPIGAACVNGHCCNPPDC